MVWTAITSSPGRRPAQVLTAADERVRGGSDRPWSRSRREGSRSAAHPPGRVNSAGSAFRSRPPARHRGSPSGRRRGPPARRILAGRP
jgi:hypothetical protein